MPAAETVWEFKTARFRIALTIEPEWGYAYDGDDEGGETQAKLDSGEYVAFKSIVTVTLDGIEIGCDVLGGSVYDADSVADFWTAHRDHNPMNRNCSVMRAAHGENVCICHYFPSMVAEAIDEARAFLARLPATRAA